MKQAFTGLQQALALEAAVLVRVVQTQGSTPRETGAWMAVLHTQVIGSIGGGHLEFDAIAQAWTMLAGAVIPTEPQRVALGPM